MAVEAPISFQITITGAVDDQREEHFAQAAGAADANNPEDYWPTAKTNAVEIAKSNMRFRAVIDQLSLLSLFNITDIKRVGRTQDDPATEFSFTLIYYRERPSYLKTEDENNPGTFLYGEDAVKRAIARAISTDYNQNYSFWDPTVTVPRTNTDTTDETTPPRGWAYELVECEKLYADVTTAEGNIIVTEV